jgi:hypothetical protein
VRFLPALPGRTDLGEPAVLELLSRYSSAQALAHAPLEEVARSLDLVSAGGWGHEQAQALQDLARHSTASSRAVAARSLVARSLVARSLVARSLVARSLVARTLAPQLQELAAHLPPH